jgi:hypothetical protein
MTALGETTFTSADLLAELAAAPPLSSLDLQYVPTAQLSAAVAEISRPPGVGAAAAPVLGGVDLGEHVQVVTYWWGVEVQVDHDAMGALQRGGAAAALVAVGVNPFAGAIIAGVIGIWSAFDVGNGVNFYVTWAGVHWFTPR